MTKKFLSVFMLAMICFSTSENIANIPLISLYGFSLLFYLGVVAIFFFIPLALISAELATIWPKGGIYKWVKEAFGPEVGFLAIWLQWMQNVIWFPTILIYIASTFGFMIHPSLAQNKWYLFFMFMIVFWGMTFVNFFSLKISGWISSLCSIFGSIIPAFFIIVLGFIWFFTGNPSQINFDFTSFIPNFSSFSEVALVCGLVITIAGMEMPAVHANELANPQKDYPKAIFIGAIIIFTIYSLGSLTIAMIVPKEEINLGSGAIHAFDIFFQKHHLSFAIPILALMMTFGALGMLNTWILGPAKGLLHAAERGELPPLFRKKNQRNMPINILCMQGIVANLMAIIILFKPTINSSYWILYNLTAILYLTLYFLLFSSAIRLRFTKPDIERHFKVPFGNVGMCIFGGSGLLVVSIAWIIGFFPSAQIPSGGALPHFLFLFSGIIFLIIIPSLIHKKFHKKWKEKISSQNLL